MHRRNEYIFEVCEKVRYQLHLKEDQWLHINKLKNNYVQKVYDNTVVIGRRNSEKGQISTIRKN